MTTLNALSQWYEIATDVFRRAVPEQCHRVLFYGPPGTGKTSFPFRHFGRNRCLSVTLFQGQPVEDLLGCRTLCNGNMDWVDGPATSALRDGKILVVNEIDQYSADVVSTLNAILDDRDIASLALPVGEIVQAHDQFAVVGTTNRQPAELPEALLSRFDVVLCADKPVSAIYESIPTQGATLLKNRYNRIAENYRFSREIDVRSVLSYYRLTAAGIASDVAAKSVFGTEYAEIETMLLAQ